MAGIRLGLVAVLCAAGVQAAPLYNLPAPIAPMASPGTFAATFTAGAGAGNVTLQLQGFNTLDGDNGFIDIFHLSVDGTEVFSGTWDLGGGGANRVLFNPNGATVTFAAATRTVDISVPVSFVNGPNSVVFAYDSPTTFEGTSRAGPQGLADEGWGLNSVSITGNAAVNAVPEPESYALMLAGLAAVGLLRRRRKA